MIHLKEYFYLKLLDRIKIIEKDYMEEYGYSIKMVDEPEED
jgi:hypothetical protein